MNWSRGDYTLTDDRDRVDIDVLRRFLAGGRFLAGDNWAAGRSREQLEAAVAGSICFSVFCGEDLVGFVRALTDRGGYTFLVDLVVDPTLVGQGHESWALECVLGYPAFAGTRFMLVTADDQEFYRGFGFEAHPMECMVL